MLIQLNPHLPRCFPATHYTPDFLTQRGSHELPQALRFHPQYVSMLQESASNAKFGVGTCLVLLCSISLPPRQETQKRPGHVVNPVVAEWLCGLPAGWTSTEPFDANRRKHLAKLLAVPGVRRPCLDLFSGCLGLCLGLRRWFRPVAYVDICPEARAVIGARIADQLAEPAPIYTDVRDTLLECRARLCAVWLLTLSHRAMRS